MSEEKKKKTNFFKQAFKSIKDLDKYEDFAEEQSKVAFKYLFKLALVFTMIVTAFYTYKIVGSLNDIYSELKNVLPEFSYAEEKLTIDAEQPIILKQFEETIGKVIIDTNVQENATEQYKEEINDSTVALLILKDKVIMTSNGTAGQVMYNYSDLTNEYGLTQFNKQDVINFIDGINPVSIYSIVYMMIFVYLFISYFISILIDVLILALLAFLISRVSRISLKFAPSFNIAVHGVTLPVLLNLIYIIINLLTGFTIKHFQLMYTTISYIYVIVAILMIKTDFINRQLELIKLAKEQEKVREELQKQKEEKEKEEDNKEKDKKPEEKKKKQKEDDGDIEGDVNPSVIKEK